MLTAVKALWNKHPKVLSPILLIVTGFLVSYLLIANRPEVQKAEVEPVYPTVRVQQVQPQSIDLTVYSQGTVQPRTESELIPEVSGQVVEMSPSLVSGGYFEKGDLLLKIAQEDYQAALDKGRAAIARAEVEFETASAENKRTIQLGKQKLASQSQIEESQRAFRVAEANLLDANISLQQAARDLQRTTIRAPFAGRIRAEHVDLGQFVSRGNTIATLYATESVEIRVPIANSQLAFLDLPLGFRGQLSAEQQSDVVLKGDYAGISFDWSGKLVRAEAEIDAKSRMFYGVVRAQKETWDGERPPLMVGLFVRAEIKGRTADNIVVLPRAVIRDNNQVLIVDQDDRLRFRGVELLRIERDNVLISGGLDAGERVCVSQLQVAVEGMRVNPVAAQLPAEAPSGIAP